MRDWNDLSDLEQAQQTYSDMYKDAYNFRPRGVDTSSWTLEDFEKEFKHLGEVIERAEAERKVQEYYSAQDFEKRVEGLISTGAKNRETALQWIMAADNANGDLEYLAYLNDLPYGYFNKTI